MSHSQRNELQKQTNAPSLCRNKFYKIMNENKHKSCPSSSENILIEESFNNSVTPKPACNRCLLFLFLTALSTRTKHHGNCDGLSSDKFLQEPRLAESIFNGKSRKLEVWQFSSVPTLPKQRWNRGRVWTIFLLPVLQLSCPSLICGKSQCLETGNQFGFTEYNCGLLQNAIQQPPFCLFTDYSYSWAITW